MSKTNISTISVLKDVKEASIGLLWQIQTAITKEINSRISDKMKSRLTVNQYLEKRSQLYDRVLTEFDFVAYFREDPPIALNDLIKDQIIKEFGKEPYTKWMVTFREIDIVLCHFWLHEQEYSHEATIISPYWKFLKENLRLLGVLIPTEFAEHPNDRLDRKLKLKMEKPKQFKDFRPNCVECGSSDVIKNGVNWLCKSCGRQWLRNPRRKKKDANKQA